ncbi:MAG: DUF4861 family protein [Cyclobacteriaceae bacterium]
MNHYIKPGILFLLLTVFSCQQNADTTLELYNQSELAREGEVVRIKRSQDMSNNLMLSDQFLTQIIDLNSDGIWDQLLIQLNFSPEEKKEVQLKTAAPTQKPEIDAGTDISFSVRADRKYSGLEITEITRYRGAKQNIRQPFFHLEGPGIENDKVAFRTFFDPRNGKDIYGKTTERLTLHEAGIDTSWHKLSDWGMDILQVGNSLGAGGLAILEGGKLHRLGDADKSVYTKLYSGSLEAAHQIDFLGWDAGFKKIEGYEQLTLTRGKYYYSNEIGVSDTTLILAVGMPNFKSDSFNLTRHNDVYSSVWTYARQADGTNSKLGMAIMFENRQYHSHSEIKEGHDIGNTNYVALKARTRNKIYFFACWELSNPFFSKQENFEQYLQDEAEKLSNPIQITKK